MRERLIELMKGFEYECQIPCYKPLGDKVCHECKLEQLADYFLKNGVIAPPCKVGDKVWLINNPREYEVLNFHFTGKTLWATLILLEEPTIVREMNTLHFGKTVFLTKEEAEAALKGGAE